MAGNSHTTGAWGGFPRADYKIDARAPQHDQKSNKPISAMTGTNANLGMDAGAWNFMFHGPTSPAAARTGKYAAANSSPDSPDYDPLIDPSLQSGGSATGGSAQTKTDADYLPATSVGAKQAAFNAKFTKSEITPAGTTLPTGAIGSSTPSPADAKAPQVPIWGVPPISSGYDPLMTPKPFMPHSPSDKFTVPPSGISPAGSGISVGELDRQAGSNLAANKAMSAPGGAAGFWGSAFQPSKLSEAPTVMDANRIAAKYASPKSIAMNNWLTQKPLSNG